VVVDGDGTATATATTSEQKDPSLITAE